MNSEQLATLKRALKWAVKHSSHPALPVLNKAFEDGDLEFMEELLYSILTKATEDGSIDSEDMITLDWVYSCFNQKVIVHKTH